MTRLWRCHPRQHIREAYLGQGGLFVDGRWHNRGRPIAYASTSPGTAILEALVHVGDLPQLLESHLLIGAELPDHLISPGTKLPDDWNAIPFIEDTQLYGDAWLDAKESLALRVPSSVVPDDNVLINPLHPDFASMDVDDSPIAWDPRLTRP